MKLNSLFTDHAVLPTGKPLAVWGKATPDAWVSGRIGKGTSSVQASSDGTFVLRFAPLTEYGPVEFQVSDGEETITLQDVQAGEVWLAAGQSNMGFSLARELPPVPPEELRRSDLRFFHVPEQTRLGGVTDAATAWEMPSENASECGFTAVGFHFAEKVANERSCAVGIIQASFGGASIASFLNRENTLDHPFTREYAEEYFRAPVNDTPKKVENPIRDWLEKNPPAWTIMPDADAWQQIDYHDANWATQQLPDSWSLAGHHYLGAFRYRRAVHIPETWRGDDLELSLGMIDQQDITWFNGTQVGATGEGLDYASFATLRKYPVAATLVRPGAENVVAVRALSFTAMILDGGLMGPAEAMFLRNPRTCETISLTGEWRFSCEQLCTPAISTRIYQTLGAGIQHSFSMMHDNLLKPVIPYPITGVIWYQGEADSTEEPMAIVYEEMLNLLCQQCRKEWNDKTLPFLVVQLPGCCMPSPYQTTGFWPITRQAQYEFSRKQHSYPAVTADVCSDPIELHFPDKRTVGERLARLALHGENDAKAHGPQVASMEFGRDNALRLSFVAVGKKLSWRNGVVSKGFMLAGEDGVFHPADARIVAPNYLEIISPQVPHPKAVRYGWSQNPGPYLTLVNSEDLPASPFELG
ncbi:MAG: hypothetical protein II943_10940 [Victivallales bacterium]|nr:hypothetical protein [Victivallales bacterium]